jgi:VWFA-related protein
MSLRSPRAGVPFCVLLWCLPALSQQQSQQQPSPPEPRQEAVPPQQAEQPATRIQVQVNEVVIPVTVTDDRGKFLSDLTASDFRIYDEGKPQRITYFSHAQKQPIVVGFLLDLSNATRIHWDKYREAVNELIWAMLPGDKKYAGYLISYSNEAELVENTTWDGDKLTTKINKLKPGGGAALYDAIYLSCTRRELVKGEPYQPRRIIIVIGDGHDTASNHTLEQVMELALRNQVTIYAVSTVAFGFTTESQATLERITSETGGHVEYPLNTLYKDISGYLSTPSDEGNYALKVGTGGYAAEIASNITKAVGALAGEVATQYVLRYRPDVDPEAVPKSFRKIRVDVPGLPNLKIHARSGYYPEGVRAAEGGGQQ